VDIQQIAVEIAKLRFFISLLVDEKIDQTKDNWGIEPLPNLDFKIMQGNSLLEEYEGVKLFDEKLLSHASKQEIVDKINEINLQLKENDSRRLKLYEKNPIWMKNKNIEKPAELLTLENNKKVLDVRKATLSSELKSFEFTCQQGELDLHEQSRAKSLGDELKRLHKEFFETNEKETKDKIKKQIEKIGWDLIEATLKEQNKTSELKKLEQFKKSNTKPFFLWKLHFADVFENGGFDIVIANPPYIRVSKIEKIYKYAYKNNFKTAYGSYDIYTLFFERSFNLLEKGGIYCFITSNKFLIADYAKPLRDLILNTTYLVKLIDLADCRRVFASALVSPIITMGQNTIKPKCEVSVAVLKDDDILKLNSISFTNTTDPFSIHLINDSVSGLMKKIELDSIKLEVIADIRTGVMGFDYWSLEPFISEGYKKDHIRIVTNGFIDQYKYTWGSKGRLYKKDFYEPYLDFKNVPLNKTTKELFLKKKIIIRGVAQRLSANIDNDGSGLLVAVHSAIINDLLEYNPKYILALLNSSLMNWVHLKKLYSARIPEGSLKYPISFIKNIPIRYLQNQKPFIEIVDKILAITKASDFLENSAKKEEVKEYEKLIDQMVYNLYGLTEDEIKIVELSD
jgi:hypothetical protein